MVFWPVIVASWLILFWLMFLYFELHTEASLGSFSRSPQVVMPMFGLGVFLSEPGDETRVASELALANDYIMIDTAQGYDNEQSVGEAIKDKDRSSLFIVTKLAGDNHGAEGVRTSIRESLEKLGTDYVDLFLIHNPRGLDVLETWEAMLEVKAQGLARAVGVSNFGVSHLKALKAAGLEMPEVNQVELHCWHQQTLLVKYHATENIATMGYCPSMSASSSSATCTHYASSWAVFAHGR
jgi:diketogulonate reductase-like aldo/keto reductase